MGFGFDPRLIALQPEQFDPDRAMQSGMNLGSMLRQRQQEDLAANITKQFAGAPPEQLVQAFQKAGLAKEAQAAEMHAQQLAASKAQYWHHLGQLDETTRKREHEQDSELATIFYGSQSPEDWEQRKAFALQRGLPKQKVEGMGGFDPGRATILKNMVIPPSKQIDQAEQERHNRENEARPVPGMMPMPVLVTGEGGVQQVIPDLRQPTKPVVTPTDATGKPIVKPTATKPLSDKNIETLKDLHGQVQVADDLLAEFKDGFAGKGLTGGAQVALAQELGSTGSPDQQALAKFWANFSKMVDLPERNKTFGASLSTGEKSSWEGAKSIKPGSDPKLVREQLAKMKQIASDVRQRLGRTLAKDGKNVEAIEEWTGPLGGASAKDQAALKFLQDHPNDPTAPGIAAKLKRKGLLK